MKKKVLALCDYTVNTGFGVVAQNIISRLDKTGKYDFTILGINYAGLPYDHNIWPGRIYPAVVGINPRYLQDYHGRQHFLDILCSDNENFDLVFIIQDTFIIEPIIDSLNKAILEKKKRPPVIFYFPIDASPKRSWVDTVGKVDYPVAYTEYAKNECVCIRPDLKDKIRVIYHGCDTDNFYPIENWDKKKFIHDYFNGMADDKFIIMNVNRNQPRKDPTRNFMILNNLKSSGYEDIFLYMHMAEKDQGGNLRDIATHFGLEWGKDWACPLNFRPSDGIAIEALNRLYNAADCFLSTTMGEGFALTPINALATKLPMVLPDNSCLDELYGSYADMIDCGYNDSMWVKDGSLDVMRPLMDVDVAAQSILEIKEGNLPAIDMGYKWAKEHSWDVIIKQWESVFDEAKPMIVNDVQGPSRADRRRIEREQKKLQKKKKPVNHA